MYGMKVSFDLKSCTKLSTKEINKIFNNCGQAVSGATITLPNTSAHEDIRLIIEQKADKTAVDNIVNAMYPVGIIVEFVEGVDPNTKWVGTTWEQYESSNKWKRTA